MKIDAPLFHVSLCHDLGCQEKILLCILVLLGPCFSLYSLLLGTLQSPMYCNKICTVQQVTLGILQAMEIRRAEFVVHIIFCPKFRNLNGWFKGFWWEIVTFLINGISILHDWKKKKAEPPKSLLINSTGFYLWQWMRYRHNLVRIWAKGIQHN